MIGGARSSGPGGLTPSAIGRRAGRGQTGHQRAEEQQPADGPADVERPLHCFTLPANALQCKAMQRPRPLRVKFILPALTEATSPNWRPIKYSLFPPLGLATLASYLRN